MASAEDMTTFHMMQLWMLFQSKPDQILGNKA
jgi:hypothetical protein